MKNFTIIFIIILMMFFLITDSYSQERRKLAQTGLKFLSMSTDARLSGIGDAASSLSSASTAMFYNPSTMAGMESFADLAFSTTRWIADINYLAGSAAFKPWNGDYGVIGVSVVSVDYGEFQRTIFAPTEAGFLDIGTYKPTAIAIGLGYAKELSEKFAVGANVKYVKQDLGNSVIDISAGGEQTEESNSIDAIAFDFGLLYHTGFKSLNFGMSIRNFSAELKYKEQSFQLPLTFRIGLSFNASDLIDVNREMHSLLVSVDASHPRDFAEQVFIGGEYTFLNTIAIRGGYSFPNDEQEFTTGVGLMQKFLDYFLAVDYAYTPFGIFNDVHRISVNFKLF